MRTARLPIYKFFGAGYCGGKHHSAMEDALSDLACSVSISAVQQLKTIYVSDVDHRRRRAFGQMQRSKGTQWTTGDHRGYGIRIGFLELRVQRPSRRGSVWREASVVRLRCEDVPACGALVFTQGKAWSPHAEAGWLCEEGVGGSRCRPTLPSHTPRTLGAVSAASMAMANSSDAKRPMSSRAHDETIPVACSNPLQLPKRSGADPPFLATSAMKSSASRLHSP